MFLVTLFTWLVVGMAAGTRMVWLQLAYFQRYQAKANPEHPVSWVEAGLEYMKHPWRPSDIPPDLSWWLVKDASPVQADPEVMAVRQRLIQWRWIVIGLMLGGPVVVLGLSILADILTKA